MNSKTCSAVSWFLVVESVLLIHAICCVSAQPSKGAASAVSMFSVNSPSLQVNTVRELCHYSRFEAQCGSEEVVVFYRAIYGRMRVGGCVQTNFGFVGCSIDVLDILDRRCTGRQSCQFDVVEPTFENRRPCNVELKNYLEVEYTCMPVVERRLAEPVDGRSFNSCHVLLTHQHSVLPVSVRSSRQTPYVHLGGSPVAAAAVPRLSTLPGTDRCGTESNPWSVVAWRQGQRINVTTIDLTSSTSHMASVSVTASPVSPTSIVMTPGLCHRYIRIRGGVTSLTDGVTSSRDRSDCGGDSDVSGSGGAGTGSRRTQRESFVFTSDGGNLDLVIDRSLAPDNFLLAFRLIGCADVWPLPAKSWVRYSVDRNAAHIGCEHSGTTDAIWRLDCELDTWAGYIGNCTALPADASSIATFSGKYDQFKLNAVSIALIWLCIAIAISLCVLIIGLTVYKRVHKRRSSDRHKSSCSVPSSGTPITPSHHSATMSSHDVETRPVCDQLSDANCQFYHAFLHSGLYASVRIQSTPATGRNQRMMAPDIANADDGKQQSTSETVTVLPVASPGRTCSWCPPNAVDLTSDCVRVFTPMTNDGATLCDCHSEMVNSLETGGTVNPVDQLADTTATLGRHGKVTTASRAKPRSVLVMTQPFTGTQHCNDMIDTIGCCPQCSRSAQYGVTQSGDVR